MFRCLLIILLVLSAVPLLRAQESRPKVDEIRVRDLVRKLDARDFETREAALTELQGLGAQVRPLIEKLMHEASVEARIRLENLLEDLGATGPEVEVELKARTLDILLDQASVADALGLLERKTGFSFAPSADLDLKRIVDLELRGVTPFQALDAFAEFVGQRWMQDYGSGQIRFYRSTPGAAALVSYLGPLRLSLDSIAINSSLVFGGEVRSNCYLQGKIDIEPRAEILGIFVQPELLEARDDQDRSLVPTTPLATAFQLAGARRNFHFNLRFDQPSAGAEKLQAIRARLRVVVPRRYDELTLPLEGDRNGKTETRDSALSFKSETPAGANRRIELRIERIVPTTGGDRPVEVPHELIEIGTSDGLLLKPLSPVQRIKTGRAEILRFDVSTEGGALRSVHLRSLVEIEIRSLEFEFGEVPLP